MKNNNFTISSNLVDILNRKIYPAEVTINNDRIENIKETDDNYDTFILPGFIDAHVHIESSMLVPSEFARLAVVHGTVATVSDPHEIANVLGIDGVRYMIDNGRKVPFKFYFGAPSCVPATTYETAGAEITTKEIRELFEKDKLHYLSEMMNYPGVLFGDPVVMEKIKIAQEFGKPIDGHAPGLSGEDIKKYINSGISTDHECFTLDEALEKIKYGMKILIREGSAAKNYEALHTLIRDYTDMVMLCSDDKHPNDLVKSHIDELVRRSVELGYDLFDILKCACLNPVLHYNLDVGQLRQGDAADFIIVDNLCDFKVLRTYVNGMLVSENGKTLIKRINSEPVNYFNTQRKRIKDFEVEEPMFVNNDGTPAEPRIRVIQALDGQLVTNEMHLQPLVENGKLVSDISNDLLKITVIERYGNTKPAIAFIKGFGLKKGAIASCVSHDSHNIIAAGVSDEDICNSVNAIIDYKGGISVAYDGKTEVLPLPVAGIMTNENGYSAAEKYSKIDVAAKKLGTGLKTPFMTLSFMALLVIPHLKLSDKGLFDAGKFEFVSLEAVS